MSTDTTIDTTDTTDGKKRKAPAFVFADNRTERLTKLSRKTSSGERENTYLGRGLNYVRAEYIAATPEHVEFGIALVDPSSFSAGEVEAVLQRCTSRQAMHEWAKIEKRPNVLAKIKHRLENKPAPSNDEGQS